MTIEELQVAVEKLEGFDQERVAHMPIADLLMAAKKAGIQTNLLYNHICSIGAMAHC